MAALLVTGACARTLPPDRSAAALYRDLERMVTIADATGWGIDRKEVEGLEAKALDSACRVEPLARRILAEWLDERLAAAGGSVEAAWRARGKRLSAVAELLIVHRVRLVLAAAERAAPLDCPFWLEPEEPFRGRQISDGRWVLHASGGGKGMVVHQGDRTDLSGGGAGRLLVGKNLGSRSTVLAGIELGATAAFPKDEAGNRTGLRLGVDVVVPVVYRYTLTNAYLEAEVGWLGRTTEDALDRLDQGVHLGASIGGRALRTRFFFPGAAFGVSWERSFVDGADLTTVKLGARVGVDLDLW
ncbi:MAG: hypothetical protein IPL61_14795 [Myxococcales bacterium]|nr:hypothetical protein [Myxococcales bacterium]